MPSALLIAELQGLYHFDALLIVTHLYDDTENQFSLLDQKQCAAVQVFLNYCLEAKDYESENDQILHALIHFWDKKAEC